MSPSACQVRLPGAVFFSRNDQIVYRAAIGSVRSIYSNIHSPLPPLSSSSNLTTPSCPTAPHTQLSGGALAALPRQRSTSWLSFDIGARPVYYCHLIFIRYTGESRTRTQLYNLPVALRVKPPGGFPKSHGRATFNVTTALSTVSAARIAYQYFPCAGDFATDGSRAYLHTHTKDEVVASIRDFWGPVPNRPGGMLGRRFAVVVTDGLCELAYGNIPTLEAQLRETLNVLHAAVHTAPNVTVYIKTNESPWTRGGGGCSVGRVLVANQLLLKLARARAPEWRVIDTFQTTVIRDDDNYDQMHYWRSTCVLIRYASGRCYPVLPMHSALTPLVSVSSS